VTEGPAGAQAGFRMRRVFEAPRDLVWREWTEPERFADWYGGPEADVPLSSVSMDVRVGGSWTLTMFAPPGRREIRWSGEYQVVDEPERLVFTVTDDPGSENHELVTVVLNELESDRTEMVLEQRGTMSPPQYERAKEGWGKFLDYVAERLSAARP
jgi:uncharacterized protein YndB with AHSA1/START domain